MRLLGITFASLAMLCVFCAPLLAQSAPSTCQYRPGSCPSGATIQSLDDGADAFAQNGGQATDAVNDAMEDASPAGASTVPGDASTPAAPTEPAGGPAGYKGGGPDGITTLPETGGASLVVLGSGILLLVFGLMARKVAG